jgi:Domain of unknown function (DUF397)
MHKRRSVVTCQRRVVRSFSHHPVKVSSIQVDNMLRGDWKKSTLSGYNGNCVEVAGLAEDTVMVRHSKNPGGGVLSFTAAEWDAFIGGVRNGEFDRKPGAH